MTDSPLPEQPPRRSGSRFAAAGLGGLAGAVLTLALIGGAALLAPRKIVDLLLPDQRARLAELEAAQADLAERLATLQTGSRNAAPEPLSDEAAHRLDQMQSEIEQLRRAIPPEGMILRLTERTETAERSMRELAQSQASAQALLLAVGQLRAAVERGESYQLELTAVRRLLPADETAPIDALAPGAANGIWRTDQLRQAFPPLVTQLLDQERAARGSGFWQIVTRHLQKVISLRRMDGRGNDAEAVLGRAEAALGRNDWEQAVSEMQALPGPFAATAAPWLQQAEARLAADRALSRLTGLAAARSAGR